jgi:uncharacterized membrane protein (UPF0127 family)
MMRALVVVLAAAVVVQPALGAPPRALPVQRVVIETPRGAHTFKMEIAADTESRGRGLMFRRHLARDAGMLFDFQQAVMTAFWMKDTPLSLDIIFVRSDGIVTSVAAGAIPFSMAEIISPEPVRVVIEINGGEARALGIGPGAKVRASAFANLPPR